MSIISYRKATLSDLEILVSLRIEFLVEFWGAQDPESTKLLHSALTDYYRKTIVDESYVSYLAISEDKFVAIGGLVLREQAGNFRNPSGKVGYIMNMYTVPAFRKKGIAREILGLLTETAKEKGIHLLELHATKEGVPLYQKDGFVIHPEPTYRKYINLK